MTIALAEASVEISRQQTHRRLDVLHKQQLRYGRPLRHVHLTGLTAANECATHSEHRTAQTTTTISNNSNSCIKNFPQRLMSYLALAASAKLSRVV